MSKLTYIEEVLQEHPEWIPDYATDCRTNDFINTRRFSPVIYDEYSRMPSKNDPEYEPWWHEQTKRCLKGYVVPNATKRGHAIWITGRMYFYLNFWIIFALLETEQRKGNRNPRFTSLDYFKFMAFELMFYLNKDQAFGKARQKGFSEFIACMLAYNFIFLPASQNVVVAGMGDYAEKTFENVKRGLNNLQHTEFYKRRSPDRNDYVKAEYREKQPILDEDGNETGATQSVVEGFGSEIYCITAKNNTQAVSRLSPFFIVYEEMGKWAKDTLIETSRFVKPSLVAEGVKTGWQVFIGTGGDMDESVADVQKLMYHPEKYNLMEYENIFEESMSINTGKVACFIPGYLFEIIDTDGNSLIEESKARLIADREAANDEDAIRDATQKPLYLSEMFMMATGGYFGRDVLRVINDQKRLILNNRDLQIARRGNLVWLDMFDWSKGVEWVADEDNGAFIITQHPERDKVGTGYYYNLYNAATDSYDKPESNSSESKGSITIWKNAIDANHTFDHWVARLTQRPTELEGGSPMFYENTVKLCMYYGNMDQMNLIEYSNILIFDYYKRWNMEYLLKERPSMIISQNVNESKTTQKYGIEPTFVPHALRMLKERLRQDNYTVIRKTYDVEMLEKWAMFKIDPHYNCDITISCALNIASAIEDRELEVYSDIDEDKDENDYGGYKKINGSILRR